MLRFRSVHSVRGRHGKMSCRKLLLDDRSTIVIREPSSADFSAAEDGTLL